MAKPILGSLQVGAATRFASNGQPVANSGYAPDVTQAQLESPPAPGEYAGLKSGPEFGIEYEANQTTPIDGSKDLLRVLSPFMIQVEPPLITGSSPNVQGGKKDYAGIYGGGHSGAPGAFNAARNRIIPCWSMALPATPASSRPRANSGRRIWKYRSSSTSTVSKNEPVLISERKAIDIFATNAGFSTARPAHRVSTSW